MQRQQGAAAAAAAAAPRSGDNISRCQTQLVQSVHDTLYYTAINTSKARQIKPLSAPVRLQSCPNDTGGNTAPGKCPTVGLSGDAAPRMLGYGPVDCGGT